MGSFLERDGYCLRPVSEWQVDLCQNESDNACFAWFVCCMCGGQSLLFSLELSLSHTSMTKCNGSVFKIETNSSFILKPTFKLVDTFFTAKFSFNF